MKKSAKEMAAAAGRWVKKQAKKAFGWAVAGVAIGTAATSHAATVDLTSVAADAVSDAGAAITAGLTVFAVLTTIVVAKKAYKRMSS